MKKYYKNSIYTVFFIAGVDLVYNVSDCTSLRNAPNQLSKQQQYYESRMGRLGEL